MTQFTIVVDCNDPHTRGDLRRVRAIPEVKAVLPEEPAAREAQYACSWFPDPQLLARSPQLKLIQAASAGVDHLPASVFASDVPPAGWWMKIFVTVCLNTRCGACCGFSVALTGRWPTSASASGRCIRRERRPIITLASWASAKLAAISPRSWPRWGIGFPAGRVAKILAGVRCYHGEAQAGEFLAAGCADQRPAVNRADARYPRPSLLQQLPDGASLINCGRGEHMVNQDVLEALDSGKLSGAVLTSSPSSPCPRRTRCGNTRRWRSRRIWPPSRRRR